MAERTEPVQSPRKDQGGSRTLEPREQDQGAERGMPVQERVQEIGAQAREWAEGVGSQIKEGAQEAMHQVSASAAQLSKQGRAAAGQLEMTVEDAIREKPLQAVLVAAGVGMLVGLLWRK